MSKPRALVTGGAGFLGSHLCDALLGEGYSVVAVDNLLTGRLSNFDHLRNDTRPSSFSRSILISHSIAARWITYFISPARPARWITPSMESKLSRSGRWALFTLWMWRASTERST